MAIATYHPLFLFTYLTFFALFIDSSFCFNPKLLNTSEILDSDSWYRAGATWYGNPTGAGTDGGACGYGHAVGQPPFYSMVSAGGPSLFYYGKGCGACYQVKCTNNAACSGKPVTVVITDQCPGCQSESVHFDLSGTAFGAMAKPGQADQLRNAGVVQVQYKRVMCHYPGKAIEFQVDAGSNPQYFATVIKFENGDGNLSGVELKEASTSNSWIPMQQSWGAVWKLNSRSALRAPLSIKLISDSGHSVVAYNVIPAGWHPGYTYPSSVNF